MTPNETQRTGTGGKPTGSDAVVRFCGVYLLRGVPKERDGKSFSRLNDSVVRP